MALAVLAAGPFIVVTDVSAQNLSFGSADSDMLALLPEKNTGLDMIYLFKEFGTVDASISYTGTSPRWYRYANLGGGFAEEITSGIENSGGVSTLKGIQCEMGYIVDFGDFKRYFYLIDYSKHPLRLESVAPASEQDCTATVLELRGEGDPLVYYTINGQQRSLDREISVRYETQEWDSQSMQYVTVSAEKSLPNFTEHISITPPAYMSTYFTVEGDKYLKRWGEMQSIESSVMNPKAVESHTTATQIGRDTPSGDDGSGIDPADGSAEASNEIKGNTDGLGGSAPAVIEFRAFCTEGVIHYEWQMATDPEFENITYRITEQNLDYTFMDEGDVYVRFIGSNSDGSCESYGDVYTVSIGASELYCPNAFSPGASEGVNDEWKVSYKSLVDFRCWIFDRYGTQLCYFDDPQKGWDGRYKGKLVKPGVYYYVIQATGSEGKKYKKSGDINIIRYRNTSSGNGSTSPTE